MRRLWRRPRLNIQVSAIILLWVRIAPMASSRCRWSWTCTKDWAVFHTCRFWTKLRILLCIFAFKFLFAIWLCPSPIQNSHFVLRIRLLQIWDCRRSSAFFGLRLFKRDVIRVLVLICLVDCINSCLRSHFRNCILPAQELVFHWLADRLTDQQYGLQRVVLRLLNVGGSFLFLFLKIDSVECWRILFNLCNNLLPRTIFQILNLSVQLEKMIFLWTRSLPIFPQFIYLY